MPVLEYILFTHAQIHIHIWTQDIHTQPHSPVNSFWNVLKTQPLKILTRNKPQIKIQTPLAISNKNPTFEIQTQTQTQISKHTDQKVRALNGKIKKKKIEEEEKTTTFGHGG